MNLRTHLNMSDVLIASLQYSSKTDIAPFWFKFGSIFPDISPYHRLLEHHISKSGQYVQKYINRIRLNHVRRRRQSFLLGKTSHFLLDTFCLMHNHSSGRQLSYHMRYEKLLSVFFKSLTANVCLINEIENITYDDAKGRSLVAYIIEKNFAYYAAHHTMTLAERLIHDISNSYFCSLHVLSEMISLGLRAMPASDILFEEAA